MITSLRLKDFKNFADETLRVGPFTLIVGANASGKSNIRDAFRFLHGVGRGYSLPEILGGKFGPGGQVEWEGIRGGPGEVQRFGTNQGFGVEAGLSFENEQIVFSLFLEGSAISNFNFRRIGEHLRATTQNDTIYKNRQSQTWSTIFNNEIEREFPNLIRNIGVLAGRSAPILPFLKAQVFDLTVFDNEPPASVRYVNAAADEFSHMRFLDPVPDRMRRPAFPGQTVLGDRGENLPAVLQAICADPARKALLTEWLGALAPMDTVDLEFPIDPSGRVHLMLKEKDGRAVSAFSASDGTLRFLALLATMFSEESKGLYFFEDIDSGVHPARLHLLLELIERKTAEGRIQVVATTHSPTMLTLMNDTTFENASVVCRLEHRRDAIIRPLADLPNVRELRETQGLGDLFETGWMEDMLHFTSDDEEEDDAEEAAQ